jgi:hypothetical protein
LQYLLDIVGSWNLAVEEINDLHRKHKKANIYDDKKDYLAKKQIVELKNRQKERDKFNKNFDKEIQKIAKKEDLNWEQLKYEYTVRLLLESNFGENLNLDKTINKSQKA